MQHGAFCLKCEWKSPLKDSRSEAIADGDKHTAEKGYRHETMGSYKSGLDCNTCGTPDFYTQEAFDKHIASHSSSE